MSRPATSSGVVTSDNATYNHLRSSSRVSTSSAVGIHVRERQKTAASIKSFLSLASRHGRDSFANEQYRKYSLDIRDYELINDIGAIDDISYLYLAKHVPTGELIALKYTDLTLSHDFALIEEITTTVNNVGNYRHRNILPYFASFVESQRLWTVTLPVKAGSCKSLLKSYCLNGFSQVVVATIIKYVLRAVVYLHEDGAIHNDICASNIYLDFDGQVYLSGIRQLVSLVQHGENQRSAWTLLHENLEWMAPERIAQNANYDTKADIYSIGITALELAFGKTPFDEWAPLKILYSKIKYEIPAFPETANKTFSKQFYRFVQLCTQKDPRWRPTAKDLLEHPFLKIAKGEKHLEKYLIRAHGVNEKHDTALEAASLSVFGSGQRGTQSTFGTAERCGTSGTMDGATSSAENSKQNSPTYVGEDSVRDEPLPEGELEEAVELRKSTSQPILAGFHASEMSKSSS